MKIIHQPHDKFFRRSLADLRVAKSFFEMHLPQSLLKRMQLDTLTIVKRDFVDEKYKNTEADVVFKTQLDNSDAYIYSLFEHQSSVDPLMAFRLLNYIIRVIQHHLDQYPGSALPPVFPLVIYSGTDTWTAPMDLFELFGNHADIAKQYLMGPYKLIDLQQMSDDELRQSNWSGLAQYVLKHQKIRNLEQHLRIGLPWIDEIYSQKGIQYSKDVLLYELNNVDAQGANLLIEQAEQYLSSELKEEVMTLAQEFERRGEQRGEQRGELRGKETEKREMALKMIQEGVELVFIAKITGLSKDTLLHLKASESVTA